LEAMAGHFKDPVAAVTTSNGKVYSSDTEPDFDTDDLGPDDFPITIRMVLQKQKHGSSALPAETGSVRSRSPEPCSSMGACEELLTKDEPDSPVSVVRNTFIHFGVVATEHCDRRRARSVPKDFGRSSKWGISSDAVVGDPSDEASAMETRERAWMSSIMNHALLAKSPEVVRHNDADRVQPTPWELFEEVVDSVRKSLLNIDAVVDAEAVAGARGWTLTVYVRPEELKRRTKDLTEAAQQALLSAAESSTIVYVLGYCARAFVPMPLGFGAALASMPDPERACWNTYSQGFCRTPGNCCFQHPTNQAGVNVMFKPARRQ